MANIIAADIGGTWGDIALYDSLQADRPVGLERFAMEQVASDASQIEKDDAYNADLSNIYRCIMNLCGGNVGSISIVAAGNVDKTRTCVLSAGNIVHWENQPVVGSLSIDFGCAVYLGNDGEGTALADAYYHVVQGTKFVSWLWGSGCNGTLVDWIDGKPWFVNAELGHQLLPEGVRIESIPCGCGQRCLESVCGGNKIRRRDGNPDDPNKISKERWTEYGHVMAAGLYNSILHYKPELVSFVGGVIYKQSWLLDVIEEWLRPRLRMADMPQLSLSPSGDSAGTLGALALERWILNGDAVAA